MAKLFKNRTDNDIKNKWYAMHRKEKRIENKFRRELGIQLGGSGGGTDKKDATIGQQQYSLGVNYQRIEPTTTSTVNDSNNSSSLHEEEEEHQFDMTAV